MSTPANFKKLSVVKLSKDFRNATEVVTGHLPAAPEEGHVFLKVNYAGINASDLNFTNGAYFTNQAPPFDCGFEGVGTVVAVGDGVTTLKEGQAVAFQHLGSFAEYLAVAAKSCVPVPEAEANYVSLIVSGLTAAIALGETGKPQRGEIALVTAAAGGTGQIAVQLLKNLYECTVIGTCSSAEKVGFLKSLGCDHVINYKKEDLDARLKEIAPSGVNLVYECVGGETFNTAMRNMAVRGRCIMIGAISSYKTGSAASADGASSNKPLEWGGVILKGLSVHGFFLGLCRDKFARYTKQMLDLVAAGKLKLMVDKTPFKGIAAVPDAVDHLYSGTSYGKVVVEL